MRKYRIIKDNFSGFEAQVKFSWFPLMWFQVSDYYWINTWQSPEKALNFISQKKSGRYTTHELFAENESPVNIEFERESKLLFFKSKNFFPEVVWRESEHYLAQANKRRWFPSFNAVNRFPSKISG